MTLLASWEGLGVSVGEVREALEELRHKDAGIATRTSIATLVITVHSFMETERALQIVDHMSQRHPVRALVLVVEPESREEGNDLDALVRLHGSSTGGHAFWSDTIILTVRGAAVDHLDSIAEPLVLPDLPVVTWFLATVPGPDEPLLNATDAIVVDTKELGAVFALAAVAEVAHKIPVVDLSWVRLRPWRLLLAELFESDETRPFVHNVDMAEVTGKSAPRLLLCGWLRSRLGLAKEAISEIDDRHVHISLHATYNGDEGQFIVERPEGARYVRASVALDSGYAREEILALPDESLPWSLAEALTHLSASRVYQEALNAALVFD